ncbi:MAG: hypothetical protein WC627_04380 [Legionella sp.]|jgi:hypothetical protein
MKKNNLLSILVASLLGTLITLSTQASTPAWTFTPLTPTTQLVPANSSVGIKYLITNQSHKLHTLNMKAIPGITQVDLDKKSCSKPLQVLQPGASCVLDLQVLGYDLPRPIQGGPVLCQQATTPQCYRPEADKVIDVAQTQPIVLPAICSNTADNNIQCDFPDTISPVYYGFTNMTYALCRSAKCPYVTGQTTVSCSCKLIEENQGIYSASVSPDDYTNSKPTGNTVISTYSKVDSAGEVPTICTNGTFANCFGATCTVSGTTVTCNCPVVTGDFIAVSNDCNLGPNLIWSATSTSSFAGIEGSMVFMYNTFFGGNSP